MNTSFAAIKNLIDLLVLGFTFGTRHGPVPNAQKRIVLQIPIRLWPHRLQAGGWFPAMGQNEPLSTSHPAKNAFSILPEFQHRNCFHA
jgi:hypothetical protein